MTDWFDAAAQPGEAIDPALVFDADHNLGALFDVIREGAMLSLSLTRDGGALRVAVTNDGKTRAEYFRSPQELGTWLGHAHEAVAAQRAKGGRGGTAPPR